MKTRLRGAGAWLAAGCAVMVAGGLTGAGQAPPQFGVQTDREVIAAMTAEEKVGLVVGTGMRMPGLPPEMQGPAVGATESGVPGAAGSTLGIPRLGIPAMVVADGPAGLRIAPVRDGSPSRTYYATAFPIATLLASTWDVGVLERVGQAMGNEVREYGVDILLGPALNTHRNPLGGRNFEYFSEDPLVSGRMAAAEVKGVQSQGVGTSAKHYVANDHEWNRNTIDVQVSQRALREIYLKGFEIVVREARPWTVMSSYNKVNGTYTSESAELLTGVLRDDWGFDGLVMTDWFGGRDAVAQMKAGNHLLMPGTGRQRDVLLAALKSGELTGEVLDRSVAAILALARRTPAFRKAAHSDAPDLKAHAAVARAAAADGMVLLRNASALPLRAPATLALFGNSSYNMITGGTGSGDVNEAYSVSLVDGLKGAGLAVDAALAGRYAAYVAEQEKRAEASARPFMPKPPVPEMAVPADEIARLANEAGAALVTIGRRSGEFVDRKREDDFELSAAERSLLRDVAAAFHAAGKKVVVVLNIGGVIETASWRDVPDAILLAWQPGQEAGHAVADVLTGRTTPSGKLATTFPLKWEDVASSANFPGKVLQGPDPNDRSPLAGDRAAEIVYEDDIWVGYRHFATKVVKTAFPFGFGLSYTTFRYSGLRLSAAEFGTGITATVTVTNAGKTAGREAVQLYLAAPGKTLPKPAFELRGFAKTKALKPGESVSLSFTLAPRDLASFDEAANAWVAEAGAYTVKIGASSEDIRQSATFVKTTEEKVAAVSTSIGAAPPALTAVDPYVSRPRVIVMTDIANEPDDQMSLVRFLLYSNQFDVEGLVATTSTWMKAQVRPDVIHSVLDAYGLVQPNLLKHAPGFPAAAALRERVVAGQTGYGMAAVGDGKGSPGAELILRAATSDDKRPLWVLAWGGTNTLAQSLVMARATRTPAQVEAIVSRLRVYAISDQDDAGPWLRREFPSLRYVAMPSTQDGQEYYFATWTGISGDRYYRNAPGADFTAFSDEWVNANIRSKGPLGKLYPQPCCIHEGDTPTFLWLIDNGLASAMSPAFGGWGGRYVWRQPSGETRPFWTQGGDAFPGRDSSRDTVTGADGRSYTSDQATIWRWRTAFQHDFAARMDWTIKDAAGANHAPRVVVNGRPGSEPLVLDAQVGLPLVLDAAGTADPDGHGLRYAWSFYAEAGTGIPGQPVLRQTRPPTAGAAAPAAGGFPSIPIGLREPPPRLVIENATGARATVVAKAPGIAHVILAVEDAGTPGLTSYRRVILNMTQGPPGVEVQPPVELTTEQDHRRLMNLLGITSIRPGADPRNPQAPNAVNYDESKAGPRSPLPDPLVSTKSGRVTNAKTWWAKRRPEIVEDFDREVYGRVPTIVPKVAWRVASTASEKIGGMPVTTKSLVGRVDNAAFPAINVDIEMTLTTPANAPGPVPVIIEFGFRFPAGMPRPPRPAGAPPEGPSWQEQLIAKGWGFAVLSPNTIQADNGAGLTRGIIGLVNKGQPRKLDDWGALRAWAWGASRALDYLESDPAVDAKRVGIEGVSRYGKAALVTMAYDPRFAIAFVASSGEAGAKLHRRTYGELVENVAGSGEYHWMAGNFIKYAGPLTADDLPIDAHELIALCAPRPVFVSAGSFELEGGWVDAKGMFLGAAGAGPVYRLLGGKDLGTTAFPPIETALVDGDIAFRQHRGGHTAGPNWPAFIAFAGRYFAAPPLKVP